MHVHKLCLHVRQFSGRSHCSFLCHCFVLPTYYTSYLCIPFKGGGSSMEWPERAATVLLLSSPPCMGPVPFLQVPLSASGGGQLPHSATSKDGGEKDLTATAAPSRISPQHVFSPPPSNSPFSSPLLQRSFLLMPKYLRRSTSASPSSSSSVFLSYGREREWGGRSLSPQKKRRPIRYFVRRWTSEVPPSELRGDEVKRKCII